MLLPHHAWFGDQLVQAFDHARIRVCKTRPGFNPSEHVPGDLEPCSYLFTLDFWDQLVQASNNQGHSWQLTLIELVVDIMGFVNGDRM